MENIRHRVRKYTSQNECLLLRMGNCAPELKSTHLRVTEKSHNFLCQVSFLQLPKLSTKSVSRMAAKVGCWELIMSLFAAAFVQAMDSLLPGVQPNSRPGSHVAWFSRSSEMGPMSRSPSYFGADLVARQCFSPNIHCQASYLSACYRNYLTISSQNTINGNW